MSVDLGNSTVTNPNIATAPFGIAASSGVSTQGAGYSVADVGDVNGDGFDDFLIGGPSVALQNNRLVLGSGSNSNVYLMYGSRIAATTGQISDWLQLNNLANGSSGNFRVSDLTQLGNAQQTNPINLSTGLAFSGITLTTSNSTAQLGASVAAAGVINGSNAFIIGAPNAGSSTDVSSTGFGRAYLVYASTLFNTSTTPQTIDLDNPPSGFNVVTFTTTVAGSRLGSSVAGLGNFFVSGNNAVAIGAPNATVAGQGGLGAVYAVSGASIPGTTGQVVVSTLGQSGGPSGVLFAGASSGAQTGTAVAGAGDVDGDSIADLLIGAPGTPAAYLVYGRSNFSGYLTSGTSNNVTTNYFSLAQLQTASGTGTAIAGAAFTGSGDQAGFAVSTAGDFNADGLADILVGSPGFNTNAGRATLIYGRSARYSGAFPLASLPSTVSSVTFTGTTSSSSSSPGDLVGYSLSAVGKINSGQPNLILVGSPGFNNGAGAAYLLPGNTSLTGTYALSTAESAPLSGIQFTASSPVSATSSPTFFGSSVSGRLTTSSQTVTADRDLLGDFIIGAAGYSATSTRILDGGAFIVEGGFLSVPIPPATGISTQIGVGQPFGPFTVNATTPAALDIYVFSTTTTTPPFNPVTDIDPTTIVVNGVAYPNATITQDPVDENNDGIPDAIITITPRSNLGLTSATTSLTITGKTLASSPLANQTFTGTAAITVTGGGGGGGGGGVVAGTPIGFIAPGNFVSPFGANQYVPTVSSLSEFNYAPIPIKIALQQYHPQPGFAQRIYAYHHPNAKVRTT
ncbi:MAG: hypothetical protein ABS79_06235, partial [Planctomycetes bacterium SCN 63-9]